MKNMPCLLLMVALVFLFGSCGKGQAPKKPMAEKVRPAGVKEEKKEGPEVKKVEPEEYKYDVKGGRDPFLSLIEVTKKKPTKKKGASPFESYDIEDITLLAIASHNNKHYALIRLPDKKTYTITESMAIGLQSGKVERITKDTVVIKEYVKDYRGEIKPKESTLKLHKGEE